MAEQIRADYLKMHFISLDDIMELIRVPMQAQMIIDKMVITKWIYV